MEILQQLPAALIVFAFLFLLLAVPTAFIIAVWRRNDIDQAAKIMWMIFFVIAPFISILCYVVFGYKRNNIHY